MASDLLLIASEEDLQAFSSAPARQRKVLPALRGVVAEIATSGVLRYPWPLVRTLMGDIMEQVLLDFEAETHVDVGPPQAGMGPEAAKQMRSHLGQLLAGCSRGPPFTLQRFAELLLAPNKQYSRFDKLALALEKQLMVVSVFKPTPAPPPRPRLSELLAVNENPAPPDLVTAPGGAAGTAAQQPAGLTATGALANGGDDAARAVAAGAGGGFVGSMHAAAEPLSEAFINSVFSDPGSGANPPQGGQSAAAAGLPQQQAAAAQAATAVDIGPQPAEAPASTLAAKVMQQLTASAAPAAAAPPTSTVPEASAAPAAGPPADASAQPSSAEASTAEASAAEPMDVDAGAATTGDGPGAAPQQTAAAAVEAQPAAAAAGAQPAAAAAQPGAAGGEGPAAAAAAAGKKGDTAREAGEWPPGAAPDAAPATAPQ